MPITDVIYKMAVCDGCGYNEFHGDYDCTITPVDDVEDEGGVVLKDGRVLCSECTTPDELEEGCGGYFADEKEYLDHWEHWRRMNAQREAPRINVPEPLGWAYWQIKYGVPAAQQE